ncbi:hypothetical protein EMIHUDRAFT_435246 [Emiliania huxleyi CCMP1516]|uniref:Uncharacterized protein n=2 Tax=Emiliania huxleyi TaxID=2903 RepID=A0A0D3JNI1_EMIH1|nr:hypothetical protein EMIHUDRAFT_435246 [Emiliania huxleyi CCMP1516]EOD25066.1 hypothetical protein EMIHUDRAFT_435246 [Emiliania huxleyi CCMP1516]|eukprot:XP_005777495.1 hypothetical protein EMIHUDRAFT_435246 [Emiliania huxleyi CCMP1516]
MSCGLALAAAPCRTGLPLASRAVPIVASLQSSVGGGFVSAAVKMGEGLIAKAIRSPLISVAALLLLAVLALLKEKRAQAALIESGEACMLGDEDSCREYDEGVQATPRWKLEAALSKLPNTNVLGNKLAESPPPMGFTWGKSF